MTAAIARTGPVNRSPERRRTFSRRKASPRTKSGRLDRSRRCPKEAWPAPPVVGGGVHPELNEEGPEERPEKPPRHVDGSGGQKPDEPREADEQERVVREKSVPRREEDSEEFRVGGVEGASRVLSRRRPRRRGSGSARGSAGRRGEAAGRIAASRRRRRKATGASSGSGLAGRKKRTSEKRATVAAFWERTRMRSPPASDRAARSPRRPRSTHRRTARR